MKRVHVVEFEDFDWFPPWLRTCMTNDLVVLARVVGVSSVLASLVTRVVREEGVDRIVDLGSGAGGVMPDVLQQVRASPESGHVGLTMTDLYPNEDAMKRFNRPESAHIEYQSVPVDATDLANAPAGLKTMSNCFHHMRPDMARAILKSAHDSRQPLLIYEMGANTVPFAGWVLSVPLALPLIALSSMILTLFVRPMTFRQLFFTYVIPLIPLFYAWDGHASTPRIYTMGDLDTLLEGLDSPEYRWEKGPARNDKGRALGTYLLGVPVEPAG